MSLTLWILWLCLELCPILLKGLILFQYSWTIAPTVLTARIRTSEYVGNQEYVRTTRFNGLYDGEGGRATALVMSHLILHLLVGWVI